ncbi:MAG: hypothetical protein O3B13_04430 [Planctomycetota bacterium]|nr:hypothetical protein [Planctomycetota bacterium]
MTHRPIEPAECETDRWSADDGDDSVEFAEFTGNDVPADGDDDAAVLKEHSASAEIAPPAWFRKKQDASVPANVDIPVFVAAKDTVSGQTTSRKRERRKGDSRGDQRTAEEQAGPLLVAPVDEQPTGLDWKKDWKKIALAWLVSNASRGYGVSLIVHTILLAGMSAIIFHNLDENQSISMIITDSDSMPIEFTEIMDLTMESAGSPQTQLPQLQKIPLNTPESVLNNDMLTTAAQIAGGNGEGGDSDDGKGFMFAMPQGGKAVSKGSFSAWTVPEDPKPRQDYMIVIRIRLPDKTKLYRISDLTGKVEGSDMYEQYLPFDPNRKELVARTERSGQLVPVRASDRLRVVNNHVQIMIPVMGAASLVRDTIEVKSRMLNEDQRLEIVF